MLSFSKKPFQKKKKCYFIAKKKKVIAFLAKASYLLFLATPLTSKPNTQDSPCMRQAVLHLVYFGLKGEAVQHDLIFVQLT